MDCTIANVGEKLIVGQLDTSFLSAGTKLLPGTAVLNGPVFIGASAAPGVARATCMIGTPLGVAAPASLEVTGIANFLGNTNTLGIATFDGIEIKNSLDNSNGVKVNNGAHVTTSNKTITGNLHVTGAITGPTPALWDGKKSFDIPHPSKENHRLRYICLEGPSADVFVRGKLKGQSTIELPDYWKDLVDEESITVDLTPISQYQELFVSKIEGTKIHIKNNSAGAINCYYSIYGERKDTSKNISEYQGNSFEDYPGDNREYVINGNGYKNK